MKLVIFDFDDTVMHLDVNWNDVRNSIIELAQSRNIEYDWNQRVLPLSNGLARHLKKEIDAIFFEYETACVDKKAYVVFPEMLELVDDIHSDGHRLAVASGNCTATIKKVFSEVGILEDFDFICGRDLVQNNKPDPEPLLRILHELQMKKEESLFIGNSKVDELAASSAGVRFYKVTDPGNDAEKIRKLI